MKIFPDSVCQQARLSRDARFDGLFFVGVMTTGIYCRPICPAVAPKEENVQYFGSASEAAHAGLRPCLRCRPESAPGSSAWMGTDTTLKRAVSVIEQEALNGLRAFDIEAICLRLGISSRWLRQLFAQKLGVTPVQYANYCRVLFAKQLLHQTTIPITDIAYAAGFSSVRRFNEVFQQQLKLTPTDLRKTSSVAASANTIQLNMSYRPPYDWNALLDFYRLRAVDGMEWFEQNGREGYGRTLQVEHDGETCCCTFFATQEPERNRLNISIELAPSSNIRLLPRVISTIKRMLDLDADPEAIMRTLMPLTTLSSSLTLDAGTRIAGVSSLFEAGIRAVLGQQVSVKQAINLLNQLVQASGQWRDVGATKRLFFPTAEQILANDIQLPMPKLRQQTLKSLAQHCCDTDANSDPESWLPLKGIGPWTVAYAKMRGQSWPDVLLASDLVIKKQLQPLMASVAVDVNFEQWLVKQASPWGSYLTFMLWRNA